MSSPPSSTEIAVTLSAPPQNLRLLEFPPELLDLLSSPDPPKLCFKSSANTSHGGSTATPLSPATRAAASHLHLCTPTHTYQVRQVSTSNSVYVLAPSSSSSSNARPTSKDDSTQSMDLDDDDNGANAAAQPPTPTAMTAISKIDTMLELLPVSHDVNAILERLLPVYDPTPDVLSADEVKSYYGSHSSHASKRSLFTDVPAADAQCELAWRELMAFEFEGRCAKPGKAKALAVWGAIMDHGNLERVDLTGDVELRDFFESQQADPIDNTVAEAVLRFLEEQGVQNSTVHSLRLDRVRTVYWTGVTLLQVTSEKVSSVLSLLKDDFTSQWQDLLPEPWREDATLDKLPEGCYTVVPADGRATIVRNGLDQAGVNSAYKPAPDVAASASEKTTAGKRKWHEKFKAQRKEFRK